MSLRTGFETNVLCETSGATSNAMGTKRAMTGQPRCRNRTASTHSNFLYGRSAIGGMWARDLIGACRAPRAKIRRFGGHAAVERRRIFNESPFPRAKRPKPNSDYQ